MPIPEFIVRLREKIGHDPLWIPSVTAIVLRDSTDDSIWAVPEVLLVRRADNGKWTPVTGICEPGEEPHVAAVREVQEETGVEARVDALIGVGATKEIVHVNGDKASYMATVLRLTPTGSQDAVVGDDESSEVGWFSVTHLPVEDPQFRLLIADAVAQRKRPEGFTPRLGFTKRN